MRKLLATFVLFSLTLWAAAGFWEKKKFTEWTDKEVDKILKDSPWAHSVDVPLGGAGNAGGPANGRKGGGRKGGGGGNVSDASNGGGGGDDFGGAGVGGGGGGVPSVLVGVRWHSALPVKQAVARRRFGAEAGTSAEAAKVLAAEPSYVVGIGPIPTQMIRGDAAAIKSAATLSVKGRETMGAVDVKADRQGNTANLYFFFPKTQAFTVDDNEVEVAFKLNALNFKRKFKLKEMMYDGKLEL